MGDDLAPDIRRCGKSSCEKRKNHQKMTIVRGGFRRKTPWFWQTDHNYSMESAKHWELPGEELETGTRRSENHLNGGIDCISSFVPHSNWGSKSTKFDDLLMERRSKSMLLKTLQHMSGRPPLIVYEQNMSPKAGVTNGPREERQQVKSYSKLALPHEGISNIDVQQQSTGEWAGTYIAISLWEGSMSTKKKALRRLRLAGLIEIENLVQLKPNRVPR
ncbi:hypothetical protein AgCh_033369 [Apium graveolens]